MPGKLVFKDNCARETKLLLVFRLSCFELALVSLQCSVNTATEWAALCSQSYGKHCNMSLWEVASPGGLKHAEFLLVDGWEMDFSLHLCKSKSFWYFSWKLLWFGNAIEVPYENSCLVPHVHHFFYRPDFPCIDWPNILFSTGDGRVLFLNISPRPPIILVKLMHLPYF